MLANGSSYEIIDCILIIDVIRSKPIWPASGAGMRVELTRDLRSQTPLASGLRPIVLPYLESRMNAGILASPRGFEPLLQP
jgi:hypothetical protein